MAVICHVKLRKSMPQERPYIHLCILTFSSTIYELFPDECKNYSLMKYYVYDAQL